MGDVVKEGPGGVAKHRLIQDLRRNGVNAVAEIPERQVLPRGVDHAVDVAVASQAAAHADTDAFETFICDYENAFMSVAVAPEEMRYNCCVLEEPHHTPPPPWTTPNPTLASSSSGWCWGLAARPTRCSTHGLP